MFVLVKRAAVVGVVVAAAMTPTMSVAAAQDDATASAGRKGPWWTSAECYEVRAKYEGQHGVTDCYVIDQRWFFNYW